VINIGIVIYLFANRDKLIRLHPRDGK
jgi:hypothetical protein